MNPEDAAATGALPGDVNPEEMKVDKPVTTALIATTYPQPEDSPEHVPGGATDPIWYLLATNLAPHTESTRKRGWVEGFVAALEATRGLDGEPGVSAILQATTGPDNAPDGVRMLSFSPNADAESLARFMFERQASAYEAEFVEVETVWNGDAAVRDFWISEAKAILRWLP